MLVKLGLTTTPASRNLQPFRSINRALCICHPIMTIKKPAPGQLPTHESLKRHSSITWRRQAQVAAQPLSVPSSWSILTLAEPKAMCRGGGGMMEWEGKKLEALRNAEKYGKGGQCASKGMEEYSLSRVISKTRSWATVGFFFPVYFHLLTSYSTLLFNNFLCSGEHACHLFLQNY